MALTLRGESQIYVDYLLFMRRLAEEAAGRAAAENTTRVDASHVDAAADRVLREFRG